MLQFIFRTIGLWLLAGAAVAGIVDGMKSIAAARLVITSSGQFWVLISPATLASAQAYVHKLAPNLWQTIATPVLLVPIWGMFLGVSILFMLIGSRRKRDFIYAS